MLSKTMKLVILCVVSLGPMKQVDGQISLKIEGQVFGRNNAAIAGVLVRAYRDDALLPNPVRTDKNGYYSLSFQTGDRISLVRYDLTGWYPGKLESLSGAKDHRVNKVLIKFGETLSVADRQEISSTIARLWMLDRANESTAAQFKAYYDPAINAAFEHRHLEALTDRGDSSWPSFLGMEYLGNLKGYRVHSNYLDIKKGEAIRLSKNSLRINIEGRNSFGGIPTAIFLRARATLHVWVVSANSRAQSESPQPYSLSEQYDDSAEIQQVIFHGLDADLTAAITS